MTSIDLSDFHNLMSPSQENLARSQSHFTSYSLQYTTHEQESQLSLTDHTRRMTMQLNWLKLLMRACVSDSYIYQCEHESLRYTIRHTVV